MLKGELICWSLRTTDSPTSTWSKRLLRLREGGTFPKVSQRLQEVPLAIKIYFTDAQGFLGARHYSLNFTDTESLNLCNNPAPPKPEEGIIIVPTWQMRKLRHREVK